MSISDEQQQRGVPGKLAVTSVAIFVFTYYWIYQPRETPRWSEHFEVGCEHGFAESPLPVKDPMDCKQILTSGSDIKAKYNGMKWTIEKAGNINLTTYGDNVTLTKLLVQTRVIRNATNYFVLVGDSNTRFRADALLRAFTGNRFNIDKKLSSFVYTLKDDNGQDLLILEYFKNGFLAESNTGKLLKQRPNFIMFGTNAWYNLPSYRFPTEDQKKLEATANITEGKLNYYKEHLDWWTRNMTKTVQLQEWGKVPMIFVLQDLIYPDHGGLGRSNAQVNMFNQAALTLLREKHPHVIVWNTAHALMDYLFFHSTSPVVDSDIVHLVPAMYNLEVQFLLNYLFNSGCTR